MARRGSNHLLNYAILNDVLASRRELARREYEARTYAERNGLPYEPDEIISRDVFPASELGLLRKAADPSAGEQDRREALYEAASVQRDQDRLDGFMDDLRGHLRVLRYSAGTYFKSPILAPLTALMLLGHAAVVLGILSIAGVSGNDAFGSPAIDLILSCWAVYNAVALTIVAFSPLLLSSMPGGIWTITGGKSHTVIQLFILTAAVPPFLLMGLLTVGGGDVHPLVLLAFAAHVLLPLGIRKYATLRIQRQIRALRPRIDSMADSLAANANAAYLAGLLERKVIGTPGASLGTSGFEAGQVKTGVAGEQKTAAVLDDFVRSADGAVVFHSVRWNMDGAPYDIDHVVVIGRRVFFLDSKNWSSGNYTMLESGDTVLRDGNPIPNGTIHVQSGADTYIKAFDLPDSITQVVVWTDGDISNRNIQGPRLVRAAEMLDWLKQSAHDRHDDGFNLPLLRCLEANTAAG